MKKKILSFLCVFLILSLFAFACAEEEAEAPEFVVNEMDCVYHNDGKTVFNNMGTVYNNGGTVYNNGGVVYNNDGVTYNNGGTVYVNGGEVFNNGGEIIVNGDRGTVYETAAESPEKKKSTGKPAEKEAEFPSGYEISFTGEYEGLADIYGFTEQDGKLYIAPGNEALISIRPGVILLKASSDVGKCTLQSDGNIRFSDVAADGTLTLAFKLVDPVVAPGFGTYGQAQKVRIIAAECASVYYTLDGSEPDENSTLYTEPFDLDTSCTLSVIAMADGAESSKTSGRFTFPKITGPSFKTVNAGYSPVEPQPIVIENTGIDKLKIVSAELTGTAAKSFVLTGTEGGRVSPGQKDAKTWCVSPADDLKPGIYYAAAELTFDSGNTVSIPLVFTVR